MANKTSFKPGQGGRPKGSVNRLTRTVKEVVLEAFNALQEDEEHNLNEFARKHPRDFYQIAAKLIPTEVSGQINHKIINVKYSGNLSGDSYTAPGANKGIKGKEKV